MPWHGEFHTDFVGKSSPPATKYSPTLGKKSGELSTTKLGQIGNEKKFREPTSVTKLRETLPVSYSSAYDIDSVNNGFKEVLKRVNGKTMAEVQNLHQDMKRNYRQVSMGYGRRSDFTKMPQQGYDPGFVYDQQNNLHSIRTKLSKNRQSKRDAHTFGSTYQQYDKSMIADGLQHWTGRGPACDMGNDGMDMRVLKKKSQTIAQ